MSAQDTSGSLARSYDDFPYESHSFPQTHPDRLAAIATLFGMQPPAVDRARILELGCAAGGNLIPLAATLPGTQCLGVDLSATQVRQARERIATLGLKNARVEQADILGLGPEIGRFDYILCHGVYSWVPPVVQQKILSLIRVCLDPQGVALVSYNTYPGWHLRASLRHMMRYHAEQFADAREQVRQSRALLDFLAKSTASQNTPYALFLRGELELLSRLNDSYIAHEHLEQHNSPLYVHQFIEAATRQGLQYLGDSEFATMLPQHFPPEVQETLRRISPDLVRLEQYMDFLRNRAFRTTLLVQQETALNRNVTPARLQGLYIAGNLTPLEPAGSGQYRTASGMQVGAGNLVTQAAFQLLAKAWPRAIAFKVLLNGAARLAKQTVAQAETPLAADLLQAYAGNALELRTMPSPFIGEVSAKPVASALARQQAVAGMVVTTLRHEETALNEAARQILLHLDGAHDHEDLARLLAKQVKQGALKMQKDGQPLTAEADIRAYAAQFVEQMLKEFARNALLTG